MSKTGLLLRSIYNVPSIIKQQQNKQIKKNNNLPFNFIKYKN